MRAVNLIPVDVRPGGGAGAGGRSGGAAYALLGGLAVLVVLLASWTLTGRGLGDKRAEIASLERQAASAKAEASRLAPYDKFTQLSRARVSTVKSLAASRFDWATTLDQIARTLPKDAWFTKVTGTVAPGVTVEDAATSTSSLRSSLPVPAIEVSGCTTSQAKVARLMARLRAVPGVDRVTLSDSTKQAGGNGGADPCRGNHANWPAFDMVLFFGRDIPPAVAGASSATTPPPPPAPTNGNTPSDAPSSSASSNTTTTAGK